MTLSLCGGGGWWVGGGSVKYLGLNYWIPIAYDCQGKVNYNYKGKVPKFFNLQKLVLHPKRGRILPAVQ